MRLLVVSDRGDALGLALRAQEQGVEAESWTLESAERKKYEGLLKHPNRDHNGLARVLSKLDRETVVFFDDLGITRGHHVSVLEQLERPEARTYFGAFATLATEKGATVVGASEQLEGYELDRGAALILAQQLGLTTPTLQPIQSNRQAHEYLADNSERRFRLHRPGNAELLEDRPGEILERLRRGGYDFAGAGAELEPVFDGPHFIESIFWTGSAYLNPILTVQREGMTLSTATTRPYTPWAVLQELVGPAGYVGPVSVCYALSELGVPIFQGWRFRTQLDLFFGYLTLLRRPVGLWLTDPLRENGINFDEFAATVRVSCAPKEPLAFGHLQPELYASDVRETEHGLEVGAIDGRLGCVAAIESDARVAFQKALFHAQQLPVSGRYGYPFHYDSLLEDLRRVRLANLGR